MVTTDARSIGTCPGALEGIPCEGKEERHESRLFRSGVMVSLKPIGRIVRYYIGIEFLERREERTGRGDVPESRDRSRVGTATQDVEITRDRPMNRPFVLYTWM